MSKFTRFMKENKKAKENGKYAPTKSLTDEKGNPLEWEFRHITSKENEELRDSCTIEVQVKGNDMLKDYSPMLGDSTLRDIAGNTGDTAGDTATIVASLMYGEDGEDE